MDTRKLTELTAQLNFAMEDLEKAKKVRSLLKLGHQQSLSIRISDIHMDLTEMDRHYMQVIKRGHEMIALGAAKVLNAKIDKFADEVIRLQSEISSMVNQND